jgi:hypothetical protein
MSKALDVLGQIAASLIANSVPITAAIQALMEARNGFAPDVTNEQLIDLMASKFGTNVSRNPELIQLIRATMDTHIPADPNAPPPSPPPFEPLPPPVTDDGSDSSI